MKRGESLAAIAFVGVALLAPLLARADSVTTYGANVSGGTGYSNNPFLETGSSTGSGLAQITIAPTLDWRSELSDLTITGSARYQYYFKRYADNTDYHGGAQYKLAATPNLNIDASGHYDNNAVGQYPSDTEANTAPVTGTDTALFGSRDRRQATKFDIGASYQPSVRDSVTFDSYFVMTRYDREGVPTDYNGFSSSLNYSRQVREHLQIGVSGSVTRFSYIHNSPFDTTIYSPQATFTAHPTDFWKISGAAGVSVIEAASSRKTTTFSGFLELCRTGERTTFCANVRRSVLPTAGLGTSEALIGTLNYSYKVSERNTLIAAVSYARNSSVIMSSTPAQDYFRANLGFSHALTERLNLTVSSNYAKIINNLLQINADYGAQVGLKFRLGRT